MLNMKSHSIHKRIVEHTFKSFFLPTVVSSVAISLISITDMIIAGQLLGETALAAISIVYPITLLVMICSAFFGIGSAISISIHLGEGEKEECNRILTSTLLIAAFFSVLITIVGVMNAEPILRLCGATDDMLLQNAKQYMLPMIYGFVCMVFSPMMMTFLRNDSKPRVSMMIVLGCGVLNLFLDYLFAGYLHFGLMGIAGASVIAELMAVIIGFYFLLVKGNTFAFVKPSFQLHTLQEIVVPGLPVAMIFALQAILTTFINHVLMDCKGEGGVAIYAVIKYLVGFLYSLFDGVTGSMQPMLGIYYGEREKNNVIETAKVSFKMITYMGIGLFVLLEVAAPFICLLFGTSGEVLQMATTAVRIQALFCVPAGIIACINAFVRSTKHANIAIILTLFNNCLFDIPLILLFKNVLHNSVNCVFWGLVATDVLTIVLWLLLVVVYNKKGDGQGLLLLKDLDTDAKVLYEYAFLAKDEDVSTLTQTIEGICEDNDVAMKKAYYIALCVEELVVNVLQRASDKKDVYIDLLLQQLDDEQYALRIRDNLTEFDVTKTPDVTPLEMLDVEEGMENLLGLAMVKKMAKEYDYKRTIGMNNFRVVL